MLFCCVILFPTFKCMFMDNEIFFRKLNIDDKTAYHQIRLECLKNHPDNFGTLYEDELKSTEYKFDKIIDNPSITDFLMGAFDGEKLIGICGFIQEKKQKTRHQGELSSIYVKPTHSGKGIGFQLIESAIHLAFQIPELEQLVLGVVDNNPTAKRLYEKLHFKEYGRLEHYYKSNDKYETLVLMVLRKS